MFTLGACQQTDGVTAFAISASVPQATAVTPAVTPPFEDFGVFPYGEFHSSTVKLVGGLWSVKFIKKTFAWSGDTGHYPPDYPVPGPPYPIYDQKFSAFIVEVYSDGSNGQGYIPVSWPCTGGDFTPYVGGDDFAVGTKQKPTDPFRECQSTYWFNFGCANCSIVWPVRLSVEAATQIYGANSRGFQVTAIGTHIG